jgi:hypothetical protein
MTSIDSSYNIKENDLKRSDLKKEQTINENDLKRSDIKPKRTLLQKIIKLHIFFCVQVTTILVATLIATSLHKCYDVLIYFSFGSFISILFIAGYSLLLKFDVLASREFNEKYNNSIFNLWKRYVPYDETSFFPAMACFAIVWHIAFALLALYYVKGFITNSISTNYSYITSYIALVLLYVMNYNSGFKLYNNSLKMTNYEFNVAMAILFLIGGGVIYYFETIKSNYLNTNCLLYLL